jgi:hypothetical protein
MFQPIFQHTYQYGNASSGGIISITPAAFKEETMSPPDGIGGASRANPLKLYVSAPDNAQTPSGNRADALARRLDQRLNSRLEQIRTQLREPVVSPNTEQTGKRLDILA